ncbi:MAG: hypothetical protein IAE93_06065 [Ignavibacteria bacterium]|nr:hypothetical protein [Ignavibacteria bacterium]
MLRSGLLEILRTFSLKEYREFGEYVVSPFFNKNEAVIKLYDYIRLNFSDMNSDKLVKEMVFSEIFPNVEYNDGFMRTIMFNLTQLAEDYLAYNNYKRTGINEQLHLIKVLNSRNLDKHVNKSINTATEKVNKYDHEDESYFLDMFLIEKEKNVLYDRTKKLLNKKDITEHDLTKEAEYLIRFFFIHILKRYRYLLNRETVMNMKYSPEFLEEILDYIAKNNDKYSNLSSLTGLVSQVQLLRTEDDEHFFRCKSLYLDLQNSIGRGERYNGLVLISGYCTTQHYKGRTDMLKEYFDIQKFRVKHEIVKMNKNEYVTTVYYTGVITAAVLLNEVEWGEMFINKYKNELHPESRDSAYNFAMARIREKQQRYEESMDYLKDVKLENVFYKVNVKSLMSKLYYSLGHINQLTDQLDTYRKFLKNDELINDDFRRVNLNYVKLLTDLVKLKENTGRVKADEFRKKLEETDTISKSWLFEKLDELGK